MTMQPCHGAIKRSTLLLKSTRRLVLATLMAAPMIGLVRAHAADATEAAEKPAAASVPPLAEQADWVTAMDVSVDGKLLAVVGGQSLLYRPGYVKLFDAASGALVAALEGHDTVVTAVALSHDGRRFATAGYDGAVKLWNVDAKTLEHAWSAHKHWVTGLAFSPDDKTLATASEDMTVRLWDVTTAPGEPAKELKGHTSGVTSVAFSSDGRHIATGGIDGL